MDELSHCFTRNDLGSGPEVVSVIGSGGKTSLIRCLSRSHTQGKILSSTTTKIAPHPADYDWLITDHFDRLAAPSKGVTMAGEPAAGGKLKMPTTINPFASVFPAFDIVYLEADGSKQLPLKGWADFEPVILPQTTTTIGVVPLSVIGQAADEQLVHRFSLFQRITHVEWGQPITVQHLAALISSPQGLLNKAVGNRVLFLNQIDYEEQYVLAQQLVDLLPKDTRNSLKQVIGGSAKQEKGRILWQT